MRKAPTETDIASCLSSLTKYASVSPSPHMHTRECCSLSLSLLLHTTGQLTAQLSLSLLCPAVCPARPVFPLSHHTDTHTRTRVLSRTLTQQLSCSTPSHSPHRIVAQGQAREPSPIAAAAALLSAYSLSHMCLFACRLLLCLSSHTQPHPLSVSAHFFCPSFFASAAERRSADNDQQRRGVRALC